MLVHQLGRIDRDIEIAAPPERVYRALTDARELSAWFQVTIDGDITPGGDVWMTSVMPGHAGQRFRVTFLELTAPHTVVWCWHPGEVDPAVDYSKEPRTTVRFTLEAAPGGTRVTVAETGFDEIALARRAKVYGDNEQGWTEVLVWLRGHAERAR